MVHKVVDGKAARGSKTKKLLKLASREKGVSGNEIIQGLGWPSGSAKFRVRQLAAQRGLGWRRATRPDGIKAYRLVPAKAGKKARAGA